MRFKVEWCAGSHSEKLTHCEGDPSTAVSRADRQSCKSHDEQQERWQQNDTSSRLWYTRGIQSSFPASWPTRTSSKGGRPHSSGTKASSERRIWSGFSMSCEELMLSRFTSGTHTTSMRKWEIKVRKAAQENKWREKRWVDTPLIPACLPEAPGSSYIWLSTILGIWGPKISPKSVRIFGIWGSRAGQIAQSLSVFGDLRLIWDSLDLVQGPKIIWKSM